MDGSSPLIPTSAYKQLPPMERLFVDAYLSELQTDAARAGQKVLDYIKANASVDFTNRRRLHPFQADKLLAKPLVKAAINERVLEITQRFNVTAERVLNEVAGLAFSTIADYIKVDDLFGGVKVSLHDCTPEQLAAIKKIKITRNTFTGVETTEFELHPKLPALDMLSIFMGMKPTDGSPTPALKSLPQGIAPAVQQVIDANTTPAIAADVYARTIKKA